ncbi:hypothetical protein BCR37DRAFT_377688 [Protomyces lactucae-debilis]|uniref:Uncharacterized protein n=1 Tax=Protomyces lactucae-debilis TaxID=2754530 RepID=A0A1Y2FQ73_PROLT|nr:uncharacterized protein BCR37DRAFT_377688 [Protomyces lactucae-debilis]ORY84855.1 hypothetical protein BCR37DRAFT_377688 [Protomyces lactucae-debilis]
MGRKFWSTASAAALLLRKGITVGTAEQLEDDTTCYNVDFSANPAVNVSLTTESEETGEGGVDEIDVNPKLDDHDRELIMQVPRKHPRVFRKAWGLLNDGDAMKTVPKAGVKPISTAPYRNSPAAKATLDSTWTRWPDAIALNHPLHRGPAQSLFCPLTASHGW